MSAGLKFPEMPPLHVTYYPIQFEPIIHSGERLTILLVLQADGVKPVVSAPLLKRALKGAFGKEGEALFDIAEETARNLTCHVVEHGRPVDTWKPLFKRTTVGRKRETATYSMEEALRVAMRNTAYFSARLLKSTEKEASSSQPDRKHWVRQVQDTVVDRAPGFARHFNRSFRVKPDAAEAHIDYFGQRLAANFTMLLPGRRSGKVNLAKARLLTLQELRVTEQTLFHVDHYELIMYRPDEADPRYSDKQMNLFNEIILELQVLADGLQLRLVTVSDAEQAAERIFQQEQAA